MRFLQNTPSIPDELLTARDEGRVIFFCGAGVSRARAGLPNFFELAERVMKSLGALLDSPARRLINAASKIDPIASIGSLFSADRVFGLLEREFHTKDIEAAVAVALRPIAGVDHSAHRTLIELSRAPDGKVRLVTTNFDLLFEACDTRLARAKPPNLPDPRRYDDFVGIIHLHGHVSGSYQAADGDGFVLSSAEFGRAYLSEAWATQFIRAVMENYLIVFVGYTADDPPVQYLLEALNRSAAAEGQNLYAFHPGSESEAEARWRHKGVRPIAYDDCDRHRALWTALEAWAERAKSPGAWADKVVRRSSGGPQALLPHERGQVVHLVSTSEGVKRFAIAKRPPPASWLCVFDPSIRYAKPGRLNLLHTDGAYFDPFEGYGLDSDPAPAKIEPDDHSAKREVPTGVHDVFASTERDRASSQDRAFVEFRGGRAINVPELPSRLSYLGSWLARVADHPASVWWAAGQHGLHPGVQTQITFELRRSHSKNSALARQAWRYMFEFWRSRPRENALDDFELEAVINRDGWTNPTIRDYAWLQSPRIKVSRPYWTGPKPPEGRRRVRLRDLVDIEIEHSDRGLRLQVPDEQLTKIVPLVRHNLELAVTMETELGTVGLHVCSIEPDPTLPGQSSERDFGLSRSLLFYVKLFRRLLHYDMGAAKDECLKWRSDEYVVFALLRIWACGFPQLMSAAEASAILARVPQTTFWNSRHQRDLLLVLAKRWQDMSAPERSLLEKRLLFGPPRWPGLSKEKFKAHRAWAILDRLYWLRNHGCAFSFDLEAKTGSYRATLPDWNPVQAEKAAASPEGRGGFVRKDDSYAELLSEPVPTLLQKAAERYGREPGLFVQHDPFAGLVAERPARALGALRHGVTTDQYAAWGWQTFLHAQARKSDKPRLVVLTARRLVRLPIRFLANFSSAVTSWLALACEVLCAKDPQAVWELFNRLTAALNQGGSGSGSTVTRKSRENDWTTAAINAPAGNLAEALLKDPSLMSLGASAGLPAQWVARAHTLSTLPGDSGRYALVLFARNLGWFYNVDPAWTESNLLLPMSGEGDTCDAVLAGFFWHPSINGYPLFSRLKPILLTLVKVKNSLRHGHHQVLSNLLLSGWSQRDEMTGARWVTSDELKTALLQADEDFRAATLWQAAQWQQVHEKVALLREAWPKQMSARSSKVTARLCEVAFDDDENFAVLVDAILPLVSIMEGANLALPSIRHPDQKTLERYPEAALALLWIILPQTASSWPYGTMEALNRIGSADNSLLKDNRLIELKRRWSAR